ncbi:TetR family transcriptional regulator [Nocardiopsis ansamitocini]|uniref:TetR family transcriptional regulator n=1 Tax=Nocardiopsis ansamitocini TaxID=1670832 RepID=A0A9W6UIH5_9ACTN|nr:TetR family transcriptional regulator [Nocardiopsis ansamitocini]
MTEAIRAAVFDELAAVGYGRMSIEAVARRAGVGKTAVYRRWPSKLQMVIDVVSDVVGYDVPAPDTGSLRGDVRMILDIAARALRHPLAGQIVPDLLAEAARTPDIARTLERALRDTQRGLGEAIVAAAVTRGEVGPATDAGMALDLALGPLYWHIAVLREPVTKSYLDRLADTVATALAVPRPPRAADEAH